MSLVKDIKIDEIFIDHEWNCRGKIAPIDVQELAKDIERDGLLQPVVVRERQPNEAPFPNGCKYKLVAGFRRTSAHLCLNRNMISASIVEHMSDQDALITNLKENVQRVELNQMQEALAVQKIMKASNLTQEQIGKMLNKGRTWVQIRMALLKTDESVQELAVKGKVTQQQIRILAEMPKEEQREKVIQIKEALEKGEKAITQVDTLKKPRPTENRKRTPMQMKEMRDHLLECLENNIASVALAWADGQASDIDFFTALSEAYPDKWYPPEEKKEPKSWLEAIKIT